MELFKGRNLIEFSKHFAGEKDCKQYLANLKWSKGYCCRKCGHGAAQIRKDYSRTCNKCSDTESTMADTLFHKLKFPLRTAFFICFEITTSTKSLSARQMGSRYGITEKTARLFMHKIREAMKSSGRYPMDGNVEVDEFVLCGKENGKVGRSYNSKKKKSVCAVEFTDNGKVKRMYALKIKDFSATSLGVIFDQHIAKTAKVKTDQYKGYRPLMNNYNIEQIPSKMGLNFQTLHTMIHQIKAWIRTTYSWVTLGDKMLKSTFVPVFLLQILLIYS